MLGDRATMARAVVPRRPLRSSDQPARPTTSRSASEAAVTTSWGTEPRVTRNDHCTSVRPVLLSKMRRTRTVCTRIWRSTSVTSRRRTPAEKVPTSRAKGNWARRRRLMSST